MRGRPSVRDGKPRMYKGGYCSKDGEAYSGADSGCPEVTQLIGRQSKCLECSVPKCVLDTPKKVGCKGKENK